MNWGVFSPSVLLWDLVTLFPCCLSIRLFCIVLSVPIFCSKIFLLPCHQVVGMYSCILTQLAGWFFHCFWKSWFICIVWSCLTIILAFLLSPVLSGLFPRVVFYVLLLVLFFSFCPNMFQCSPSVLSFSLVVGDFFSVFPVEFTLQALRFCSCSFGE